jgi:hypothetical protein
MAHTFHIPVLGLAFSIDTPLKVAKYGISSVVSLVDDSLIERMRLYHAQQWGKEVTPISVREQDARVKRIKTYLDLMQDCLDQQMQEMSQQSFAKGTDLTRYYELLSIHDPEKRDYLAMLAMPDGEAKKLLQTKLKQSIQAGRIDVNIMAKVDKANTAQSAEEAAFSSDALLALRGFAESKAKGALVLSAGYNPKLYAYLAQFDCFFSKEGKAPEKQLILKVSDYRSALVQAKVLAKKGLWVSEFRVESGLNCGGHAFATEGYLMGPILAEFKNKRAELGQILFESYKTACVNAGKAYVPQPTFRLSAQGGLGTAEEHQYLIEQYGLDSVGWGSPFLLVPEVTNVDESTLKALVDATADDFYVSSSSPLGVPFNQFRKSSSERLRLKRIQQGKPGSPCTKKYLVMPTDMSDQPLCSASKAYIKQKLTTLASAEMDPYEKEKVKQKVLAKACLCEGLAASAYIKYDLLEPKESNAVAICPGPNIQWFKSIYTLEEMVGQIYGRIHLLAHRSRPHMFINELYLYLDYLQAYIQENALQLDEKKKQYIQRFSEQLLQGIAYYEQLPLPLKDYPEEAQVGSTRNWQNARRCLANMLRWIA